MLLLFFLFFFFLLSIFWATQVCNRKLKLHFQTFMAPHQIIFKKGVKTRVLKGLGAFQGWRVSKACPPDRIPLPKFETDVWGGGDGSWWGCLCRDESLANGQRFISVPGRGCGSIWGWYCVFFKTTSQTLTDCFQTCPQAEGPQLLHLKWVLW